MILWLLLGLSLHDHGSSRPLLAVGLRCTWSFLHFRPCGLYQLSLHFFRLSLVDLALRVALEDGGQCSQCLGLLLLFRAFEILDVDLSYLDIAMLDLAQPLFWISFPIVVFELQLHRLAIDSMLSIIRLRSLVLRFCQILHQDLRYIANGPVGEAGLCGVVWRRARRCIQRLAELRLCLALRNPVGKVVLLSVDRLNIQGANCLYFGVPNLHVLEFQC